MLAEKHRIITRRFGIETTITAIIAFDVGTIEVGPVAVHPVKDRLNAPGITAVFGARVAKES